VTEEEFEIQFKMWQYVMTKIALPLPPLVWIIPYLFSTWNRRKVGSDTITYLVDQLRCVIPYIEAQPVMVAWFMEYISVFLSQLEQHSSRRYEDVSRYVTLRRYKNAACQRTTFPQCIERMAHMMQHLWHTSVVLPMMPLTKAATTMTHKQLHELQLAGHQVKQKELRLLHVVLTRHK
jgi:hypothetical protein